MCYIFGTTMFGLIDDGSLRKLLLNSRDGFQNALKLIIDNNKLVFQLLDKDYKKFIHPNTEFVLNYLVCRHVRIMRKDVHELRIHDPSYGTVDCTREEMYEQNEKFSKKYDLKNLIQFELDFPFIDPNPSINQEEYIFDYECQSTERQKARKLDYLVVEQSIGPRNDLFNIDLHSRATKINKVHKLVKECFNKATKLRNVPDRYNGDSFIDYKKSPLSLKLKDAYLLEEVKVIAKRNLINI
ncbi:hypothetical protein BN7_2936 [Wickerhamomyces ciferrii]|uniref:Uncharacterized protein n=1 Tax=Wickerhamomyces ciferrii (strain ATCC 14091 / BCRC 22168 / CBS 111 / JCM 3599 / NBRC 0793 / NRRL Y-1031 F-60-10) TaxID=1206466 RepID=K0KQ93_WICCF|nr:uncharacterized protein BN7_2936 [Wickerhamomyces ciferrii]CCH43388.1 hypothetical protein BN7_2936 [Wickerhamomyces ciferrii]